MRLSNILLALGCVFSVRASTLADAGHNALSDRNLYEKNVVRKHLRPRQSPSPASWTSLASGLASASDDDDDDDGDDNDSNNGRTIVDDPGSSSGIDARSIYLGCPASTRPVVYAIDSAALPGDVAYDGPTLRCDALDQNSYVTAQCFFDPRNGRFIAADNDDADGPVDRPSVCTQSANLRTQSHCYTICTSPAPGWTFYGARLETNSVTCRNMASNTICTFDTDNGRPKPRLLPGCGNVSVVVGTCTRP